MKAMSSLEYRRTPAPSPAASKQRCNARSARPAASASGLDTLMMSSSPLCQQAAETPTALPDVSTVLPPFVASAIVAAQPSARPGRSASAPGEILMVRSTLQASDNEASVMVVDSTMSCPILPNQPAPLTRPQPSIQTRTPTIHSQSSLPTVIELLEAPFAGGT